MDTELGIIQCKATTELKDVPQKQTWLKVAVSAALVMSIAAVLVSVSVLAATMWMVKEREAHWELVNPTTQQENDILNKVADALYNMEYNGSIVATRSAPACDSTYNQSLNVKPSGHIVGKSYGKEEVAFKTINSFFSLTHIPILSADWSCESDSNGHVNGGIDYNPKTGFMYIPADGHYFIYSQVSATLSSPSTAPVELGHMAVRCACTGDCNCYQLLDDAHYVAGDSHNIMKSFSQSDGLGSTNYHGGVFHLKAGTYIGVVPIYPMLSSDEMYTVATSLESFFGIFMVNES
jgi:hypothetical protein